MIDPLVLVVVGGLLGSVIAVWSVFDVKLWQFAMFYGSFVIAGFVHELGHALGYMIETGGHGWATFEVIQVYAGIYPVFGVEYTGSVYDNGLLSIAAGVWIVILIAVFIAYFGSYRHLVMTDSEHLWPYVAVIGWVWWRARCYPSTPSVAPFSPSHSAGRSAVRSRPG